MKNFIKAKKIKNINKNKNLTTYFKKYKKFIFKIKKLLINENYSTQIYFNKLQSLTIVNTSNFNIINYMFLNKNTYNNYLLNFFLKKKEKKKLKKKFFFFNFKNKRLKTYKIARTIHWNFYLKQKTLKTRRYKKFLYKFLKNKKNYINLLFNYFLIKFKLSFNFWSSFNDFNLYFYKNIIVKHIYQFPINWYFWKFLKKYKKKTILIDKKINFWIKKKKKIKNTFWMQQKKNLPNFIKKKKFIIKNIKNNIQYDFITNYYLILKNQKNYSNNANFIFKNKFLKLHDFRYKA